MAHTSDSDNEISTTRKKLFEHEKPIHEILGGGKVADILLWRNRNVSAALLLGMTLIWFLLEIVEYNFVTLISHISITVILVFYIWSYAVHIFKWSLSLDVLLLYISVGNQLHHFLPIIVLLNIMLVIGSYFSFVNLLYIGYLFMQTLPFVYERYEEEINNLFGDLVSVIRKSYRRFDKKFLKKIPKGPLKEKKVQ